MPDCIQRYRVCDWIQHYIAELSQSNLPGNVTDVRHDIGTRSVHDHIARAAHMTLQDIKSLVNLTTSSSQRSLCRRLFTLRSIFAVHHLAIVTVFIAWCERGPIERTAMLRVFCGPDRVYRGLRFVWSSRYYEVFILWWLMLWNNL